MAQNRASFHAKISADASEFISEVLAAERALEGLVSSQGELSSSPAGGQNAKSEIKSNFDLAKREAKDLEDQRVKAERRVGAAAKKYQVEIGRASKVTEVSDPFGTVTGGADEARNKLGRELLATVSKVTETTGLQNNINKQLIAQEEKRVKLQRELQSYARKTENSMQHMPGPVRDERDLQKLSIGLTETTSQGEIAAGPTREGLRGMEDLRRLQKDYKDEQKLILQQTREREQEERQIADLNRKSLDAMVTGRYALYDMANAYQGVFDVASRVTRQLAMTVQKAAEFESAFTAVERTLVLEQGTEQFGKIRETLVELSTQIPVTFEEISEIATLGAQMGIVAEDIDEFTRTISAFSSTTGVSVDAAAEKFGRIASLLNVPVQEFENLGAAVLFAGYNAVATEQEILSMTESISASAASAGFAADETIGLATALSSLGLAPELSRGSLQRIFAELNRAVAGTSGYLDDFARVLNVSQEEAAFLWQEDPSGFFTKLLDSLAGVEDRTLALDQLGIANIRDVELLNRLSQNMDVYGKSLDDASTSYAEGTALQENYAKQADDLSAKLQVLSNNFDAFVAALSGPAAEGLKGIIDIVNSLLQSFTGLAESDIGGVLLPAAIIVTSAVTAFAGLNFVLNIATAQVLAMRTAMLKMNQMNNTGVLAAGGFTATLKTLYSQLMGTTYAIELQDGTLTFLTEKQLRARVVSKDLTGAQLEQALASGKITEAQMKQALSAGKASVATRALSIAMKGLMLVSVVGTVAMLGSVLLDATGAFELFNSEAEEAKKIEQFGQSAITAAGGLQVFTDALNKDSEGDKVVRLDNLEIAQGKVNEALETGIELLGEYASLDPGVKGTDDALNTAKAEEYRNLLRESLLEPIGDQETSFFENLSELSPADRQTIENLGLEIDEIISKEMAESGSGVAFATNIAENLPKAINQIVKPTQDALTGAFTFAGLSLDQLVQELEKRFGPEIANVIETSFADAETTEQIEQKMQELSSLDLGFFVEAAQGINAINSEVAKNLKIQLEYKGTLEETEQEVETLTAQVEKYLESANKELAANQSLQSSFRKLTEGIIETDGSMTGLDDASIKNRENFEDFITKAFELADVLGEDASFAIDKATSYAAALAAEGVDVTDMIDQIAAVAAAQLPGVAADFGIVLEAINEGVSEEAITSFVRAGFAMRIAAAKTKAEYFALQAEIRSTIDIIKGIDFDLGIDGFGSSVDSATTALQKMQNQINKTFGFFERLFTANDALRSFAAGLEENGRSFDAWSQAGQENTQNILDVIDSLATKSGGDVQRFANSLMSLRTVLANMGVGEQGLKFIDSALEELGITGVASTNEMKNLNEVLSQTGDSADDIMTVAEAVEAISSAAKSGLDTRFAEARAIDDITLALLDYEEAQEDAAEAIQDFTEDIADAKEEIDDAKEAIDEANAAIGKLTADRSKLEYQLEVALRYGDLLRAEQIRAEIASVDADIAKEQDNISDSNTDIADAQQKIADAEQGIVDVRTKSTRETIAASRALEDLAGMYVDTTAHMLANAGQGADLNGIIDDQVEAFRNNAIQMGATETEADALAKILREELIKSMDDIPEDIETEIKAETAQALSDIDYFVNRANDRLGDVERDIVTKHRVVTDYSGMANIGTIHLYGKGGPVMGYSRGGSVRGPGGPTSDKIPALLSDGEYVVQANAVDKYGIPFLNALNQSMLTTSPIMSGGMAAGGGSGIMQLSPEDRALLRAAMERPINLYTDNATIAKSANDGNTLLAQRGLN